MAGRGDANMPEQNASEIKIKPSAPIKECALLKSLHINGILQIDGTPCWENAVVVVALTHVASLTAAVFSSDFQSFWKDER